MTDHGGAASPRTEAERLHEVATLAMTLIKNEANDDPLRSWTVDRGADRFLEILRAQGYEVRAAQEAFPDLDGYEAGFKAGWAAGRAEGNR